MNIPHKPLSVWHDITYQRNFMEQLAKKLQITKPEDWYKLTKTILRDHGGSSLSLKYNGSIMKLLSSVYPEYHCIIPMFIVLYTSGK